MQLDSQKGSLPLVDGTGNKTARRLDIVDGTSARQLDIVDSSSARQLDIVDSSRTRLQDSWTVRRVVCPL